MEAQPVIAERKPSRAVSLTIFLFAVATMAYLRLYVFRQEFIALSYGLPLLICLWHRDPWLLWSMAAAFALMSALKSFLLLANPNPADHLQVVQLVMNLANIFLVAAVVHLDLGLADRLRTQNFRLGQANEQLAAREKEISQQNEELHSQSEELARQNQEHQQQAEELAHQNEELQQQTEELERQSEELQAQAEELQVTNQEVTQRESMLQTVLSSLRDTLDERQMVTRICQALVDLIGEPAAAAAVVEKVGDQLVMRTHAGAEELGQERWEFSQSFTAVVMAQGRTAFVDDLAARPDLMVPQPAGRIFRSVLATPLRLHGQPAGAVKVFSLKPQQWTSHHFRIIEWVAAQCSLVLETIRLQEELRRSEQQFRTLADALPQLAWMAEPDGSIFWYNRRWYDFTGTTAEQMQGWGWQSVHDPALLPNVLERWRASLASGSPFEMELPLRGADGHFRWFLTRVLPLHDAEGAIIRWFGTNTDVTVMREAERVLSERARLLDLTSDAILVRDPSDRIAYWSQGAAQMYGWSSNEALGQEVHSLLKTEFPEPLEKLISQLERNGRWEGFLTHRTRDGRRLIVSTRWALDRDAQGKRVSVLETNTDVTESKRAEKELLHAKEQLAKANASLEKLVRERTAKLQEMVDELEHFSYTITHDMRAPLRAMQGFAGVMEELCADSMTAEKKECLYHITSSAARMDRLITDALSYSKTVSQELPLAQVDLGALLRGMIHSYPDFQPPKARIHIFGELPPVLGNEAGLTQCFSNLLGNAVKFVAAGKTPEVRIWSELRAAPPSPPENGVPKDTEARLNQSKVVRLWFEDNGIGIPEQSQPKIFQMFQRATRDHEGTGIGLALVRKVIARMGGAVGVESQPGKGSRFWLDLKPVR